MKNENEITLKVKCGKEEFYKILEQKGFNMKENFSLHDFYYVPSGIQLKNMSTTNIIAQTILIRKIILYNPETIIKKLTFKKKQINENGEILSQTAYNCEINSIEDGKSFIEAIGYSELMNIYEDDVVYEQEGFEIACKNIGSGYTLIEIETCEKYETIESLKQELLKLELPLELDNYFVKKAEIELNSLLSR